MDGAFVQHPQHQIDDHHRGQDKPGLALQRTVELRRVTGEFAAHRVGHAQRALGIQHQPHCLAQRHPVGHIEADGHRRKLVLPANGERPGPAADAGDGGQRHLDIAAGAGRSGADGGTLRHLRGTRAAAYPAGIARHPQQADQGGVLAQLGRRFQHHAVLVGLGVNRADLALAEGAVQHVVHRLHGDAQARGGIAVHIHRHPQPAIALVAVDLAQLRHLAQPFDQARRPATQPRIVRIGQRVLELRGADPGADLDILHRGDLGLDTGDRREPRCQPGGDLLRIGCAVSPRLEDRGDAAGVGGDVERAGAGHRGHPHHIGVGTHCLGHLAVQFAQPGEGGVLRPLTGDHQQPGILRRQEALGHGDVERDGADQGRGHQQQHQRLVQQHPTQAGGVVVAHPVEAALGGARHPARPVDAMGAHQPAGHHRRQRQRHHHRDQYRDGQRQREFLKKPADHALHEEEGYEYGDERHGQRHDGEADLRRALVGGDDGPLALLDQPDDVLDHHDGVVHHEAGGDDERHQRQVIQREAAKRHDAEGADDRQRQCHCRHQRGAAGAQEQEDHGHHQRHRKHQGELHLGHRGADRLRPVRHHMQNDGGGKRALQHLQLLPHPVDRLHDVGAGLALHVQQHRALAIVPGGVEGVLQPFDHGADIGEPHRRVGTPGDDQVGEALGGGNLVVRHNRRRLPRPVQRAFGAGLVGTDDGGADILQRQAVGGEAARVGLDPDRGPHVALHGHAAHPGHLAQTLRQQRVGRVGQAVDGQGGGGQRQRHDRRVGRVHLRIDRRVGQVLRQRAARRIDRRLHILRRIVDVSAQIELQRDPRNPRPTDREDRGEPGDLRQLAFERGGDLHRHRLGRGAGQLGADLDGGEINLRQGGDRQLEVAKDAGQQHSHGEQRGGDGPGDEGRGDVHLSRAAGAVAGEAAAGEAVAGEAVAGEAAAGAAG